MPPVSGNVARTFADELTGVLQDIAPDWADNMFLPEIISSGLQIILGGNPITVVVALILPTLINMLSGGPTKTDVEDERERFRAFARITFNNWQKYGDQIAWTSLCASARVRRQAAQQRREEHEERERCKTLKQNDPKAWREQCNRSEPGNQDEIDKRHEYEICERQGKMMTGWNDADFVSSHTAKAWLFLAFGDHIANNPKYWRLGVHFEQLAEIPDVFKHVVWNAYFKLDMHGSKLYDALAKLEELYNTYKLGAETYKKTLNTIWDQQWINAGRGVNLHNVIPVQPELAPWPAARTYYETRLLPHEEQHPEPDRIPKSAALPFVAVATVIGAAAS